MNRSFCIKAALFACIVYSTPSIATPDEIEVYTDEISAPGTFGLEQHLNYTLDGVKTPEYPGQMTSHHVLQATPELYYGLTDTLEMGLYLPLAFTSDGYTFLNGVRLRLKYIAPHSQDTNLFYGINLEAGRSSMRTAESNSAMELRPIIGYKDARWLVSFNPILNVALDANVSHQPQFEPALKLMHSMGDEMKGGLEYYGAYGSASQWLPADQRTHTVYAVVDLEVGGYDTNLGVGRGLANTGDIWMLKAIIETPFN
jgi:hypothetical protein